MASREYNACYSTPGLWDDHRPDFAALEATAGIANGNNAGVQLQAILEYAEDTPTAVAYVDPAEPTLIQIAHRPRKNRGGGWLNDRVVWLSGDEEEEIQPHILPQNLFASTNHISILDDYAAHLAHLAANAHHGPNGNGDPGTINVRIRKAMLQPPQWIARQLVHGPYTATEYYNAFFAPVIAVGGAALNDS